MECIKRYKEMILIGVMVLGFGWWLRSIDATASAAAEKARELDKTQKMLTASILANNAKLEVYLELMGFDDETAREWARMPRYCPVDSLGLPVKWTPWLEVTDGLDVGVRYMVDDSANVLIDTLWRPEKKR